MIKSKRITALVSLLVIAVGIAFADALSDFTSSKPINSEQTSVIVKDLKSGRIILAHNIDKKLIPASIMKSVTTASLIEKVGPDYRYVTPVYAEGEIRDGELVGNIVIEASGDPSINTRHAPQTPDFVGEIVSALKSEGIKNIRGAIIIDESAFPGPSVNPNWAKGDLPHEYGTGTHGFNFEDNSSGGKSIADPGAVFKSKLRSALQKEGIGVGGTQIENAGGRKLVVQHKSATIDEIMRSCMMRSDNQFAETMLRLVGQKYGGSASSQEGAAQVMKLWKNRKCATDSIVIVDGSGLSRTNKLTARFMSDMLSNMSRNPYYASFFPLAGQEGTLRHLLGGTRLEGYVAMKTGSMTGIQCYAGYKLDDDYEPTHVVVIMMNSLGDRASARKEVEKLLLSTFNE